MKHFAIKCLIVLIKIVLTITQCMEKNSCPSYIDYGMIDIDIDNNCWANPDYGRTPAEIIENNGYNVDTHRIVTEDGYVLSLLHVMSRDLSKITNKTDVVLLQHGLLTNSMCWITFGPRSIAFQLVDYGYDVWLGNNRGTALSREHTNDSISDHDYWSFSFHEMGIYDLPPTINYISNATGSSAINYIGHSMGTTQAFIYAAELPEHANAHLSKIIALAPVVYFTDNSSPLLPLFLGIQPILDFLGIYEIDADFIRNLFGIETNCRYFPDALLCVVLTFAIFSSDHQKLPASDAQIFLRNYLDSASIQNVLHYAQLVGDEPRFHPFDYGPTRNEELYNTSIPPEYKLENIRLPIWLFYGENDPNTSQDDTMALYRALINAKKKSVLHIPTDDEKESYNHVDFLMDKDLEWELLPHILRALRDNN